MLMAGPSAMLTQHGRSFVKSEKCCSVDGLIVSSWHVFSVDDIWVVGIIHTVYNPEKSDPRAHKLNFVH